MILAVFNAIGVVRGPFATAIGIARGPILAPIADWSLRDDIGLDSLDLQSLACELDEAFAVSIPDDDVAAWRTPADVAATLHRLTAQAAAHG